MTLVEVGELKSPSMRSIWKAVKEDYGTLLWFTIMVQRASQVAHSAVFKIFF